MYSGSYAPELPKRNQSISSKESSIYRENYEQNNVPQHEPTRYIEPTGTSGLEKVIIVMFSSRLTNSFIIKFQRALIVKLQFTLN